MSNFIVGQITPDMLEHLKYGTFIFFGLLTFGGVLFVWLVVPETKRLTLEEMDVLFGSVGAAEAVSNLCDVGESSEGQDRLIISGRGAHGGDWQGDWS